MFCGRYPLWMNINVSLTLIPYSQNNTKHTGVTSQPSSPCLATFTFTPDTKPCLCGVHVARSLVFCVKFCRSLFVLLFFFVRPLCCLSISIDGFWLPLWYLQTFVKKIKATKRKPQETIMLLTLLNSYIRTYIKNFTRTLNQL
jgi:hypothetical protein